jgi:hypothetical protein
MPAPRDEMSEGITFMCARHTRFGVLVFAALMALGPRVYGAESAAAAALGDVLVIAGDRIKVFGHGGNLKEIIPPVSEPPLPATATASAFDPSLNLFVTTSDGTLLKVDHTSHAIATVPIAPLPLVTSIVFDQDGNIYLGSPGQPATVRRFDCNVNPQTDTCTFDGNPDSLYSLTCDASVGLWMDLAPERPGDAANPLPTQRMYYDCGGRNVSWFDTLNPSVNNLLVSLPSPGSARDLRLMPPKAGLDAVAAALAVADDRNVKLVNSFGQVIGTFDVNLPMGSSLNGWSSVEWAPMAGALWAAQNDTRAVYRFQLPDGDPNTPLFQLPANPLNPFAVTQAQVEIPSSYFTVPIASLAVNGGYRSAVYTRLLLINASTPSAIATYLDHTPWANSWEVNATVGADVRIAATLYEGGRAGDVPAVFNLNERLTGAFSTVSPLYAYRGRAAFVRAVQTSNVDLSNVNTLVTMNYILLTSPDGSFRTGLYDDPEPVSDVGFTNGDQFAKDANGRGGDITREWFQTQETTRGGTKGLNDFLLASDVAPFQLSITAPTGLKTYKIENPIAIRVKTSDKSSFNHCPDMVLTIARAKSDTLPAVLVASSLTNLTDSRGLPSVFTSVSGNNCQSNFIARRNTSELFPEETDFQPGRKYNFCINFRRQQPDGPPSVGQPVNDVCGSFLLGP